MQFIEEAKKEYRKNNCEICSKFDDPETCGDRHSLSREKKEDWEWIEKKLRQAISQAYEYTLEILDRSIDKGDAGMEIIRKIREAKDKDF